MLNVDRKKIPQKDRTLQSGCLTPFKDLSELSNDVTQGIVIGYTNLSHAGTNLLCKEKKKFNSKINTCSIKIAKTTTPSLCFVALVNEPYFEL
jgi:hypothetical protein